MNAVILGQFTSNFVFFPSKGRYTMWQGIQRSKVLLDLDRLVLASQKPWELPLIAPTSQLRPNGT